MNQNFDDLKSVDDSVATENRIDQKVIDSLPRPTFVTISEEAVVSYIYDYCRKLLEYARIKHESKEMAYAINLITLDFVGAEFGDSKSVDISSLIDRIDDSDCIFVVMHNHPSDGPFSYRDLSTFFATPNMAILMVIGNKGSIYIVEKTDKDRLSEDYIDIKRTLIAYRKQNLSFEEAIGELVKHGIAYTSI